jgi:hypothetical protein
LLAVKYFLLVFNRASGELIDEIREFDEAQASVALRARFSRELQERDNPDVEVVVLGAADRDNLETTHSRYFGGRKELSAS